MIHGWTGQILWIDLSSGEISHRDTGDYVPDLIGGRGIAARIAWDEIPPGTGAFDSGNPLMLLTGPLTGTTAPFAGRTTVCSVSPQSYPHEWFTRSSLGGHWGSELKYAGYDGVVVTGRSDTPVYIWINDDQVEIREAEDLWGMGTYSCQQTLLARHGDEVRVVTIGQAGENLSRIAVINTETESAAGQGGFGAVMGAKKLKAIAVRGTGGVSVAHPQEFLRKCQAIAKEMRYPNLFPLSPELDPERKAKYGERHQACTQGCTAECPIFSRYYDHVPGHVNPGTNKGQLHCIAWAFQGIKDSFYNWDLGFEAGFEISKFSNDYGINHWEILFTIIPWLRACRDSGIIDDLDGMAINLDNPFFWAELLRRIAFREGIGDALAEGGRRAPTLLGFGEDLMDQFYPAWGFGPHWDGRGDHANVTVFPFWLVSALQWMVDTRDPISSSHGFTFSMWWSPIRSPETGLTWEELNNVAKRVYGVERAADPKSGYEDKAVPAIWHGHRSVLKDSLTVDDNSFPRIWSKGTEDRFARIDDMEGPSFEYHLFKSATGVEMTERDLERACERAINLERAYQIRNHGRSRRVDETVIPYFEQVETWVNPFLEGPQKLDRERFAILMDEYYTLRGWDVETGRPTRAKLEELGLSDVADDLAANQLLPG